jgi:hypothetical protein
MILEGSFAWPRFGQMIARGSPEHSVMVIFIDELKRRRWATTDPLPAGTTPESQPGDRDPDDNPPRPALALAA